MRKRRIKIWPVIILLIFVILIICITSLISSLKDKKRINIDILDSIDKYGYNLNSNHSSYYKKMFKELKKELSTNNSDDKKYAELISKMFLTDFLSLDNSINKNDIGGIEFIYTPYKEQFLKKAKDTIYLYVENNIYGDRNQELPFVREVKINSIKQEHYNSDIENDSKAYYIEAEVLYKKDLGYQKKIHLILVHNNDKLEIVNIE